MYRSDTQRQSALALLRHNELLKRNCDQEPIDKRQLMNYVFDSFVSCPQRAVWGLPLEQGHAACSMLPVDPPCCSPKSSHCCWVSLCYYAPSASYSVASEVSWHASSMLSWAMYFFGMFVGSPVLSQDQASTCFLLSCGYDWAACVAVPCCRPWPLLVWMSCLVRQSVASVPSLVAFL